MAQTVFQRYELKYLLNQDQYRQIGSEIRARLSPDAYGETTVQSLYYDTSDNRLIRASLEKPIFKEKLRLRCYGLNRTDQTVYLEMKRKYDKIVYKRRIACKEGEAQVYLQSGCPDTQIGREINAFSAYYAGLLPKVLVLYDRTAFADTQSDLRVTFDRNVRYRTENLNFFSSLEGDALLPEGWVLMECKASGAYPLWLCDLLSRENAKKTSFSKVGKAYETEYSKNNLCKIQRSERYV